MEYPRRNTLHRQEASCSKCCHSHRRRWYRKDDSNKSNLRNGCKPVRRPCLCNRRQAYSLSRCMSCCHNNECHDNFSLHNPLPTQGLLLTGTIRIIPVKLTILLAKLFSVYHLNCFPYYFHHPLVVFFHIKLVRAVRSALSSTIS